MIKKIGIVGGGASGVFTAIRIKENHPDWDVSIFERNSKLLKKIYATGNGRCNFANSSSLNNAYNNDFAIEVIDNFNYQDINSYFNKIGIATRKIDNNYYPYSLNASTVAEKMINRVNELGIEVVLDANINNYCSKNEKYLVDLNNKEYYFDKLIFACGGKSSPQFGSDGSIYKLLESHGYLIEKLSPSLCPIKVKENVNKIDGVRAKALVSLYSKNKMIYEEEGEVQFRSNAISGIVNFNIAFMVNKFKLHSADTTIHMDFVPEVKKIIKKENYSSYVNTKFSDYLIKNNCDIHDVKFTYKGLYDFDSSHVSSGGISLKNINKNLESKIEKNVFFIGEILDIDGKCGGYNLMWAFASAERVANYD